MTEIHSKPETVETLVKKWRDSADRFDHNYPGNDDESLMAAQVADCLRGCADELEKIIPAQQQPVGWFNPWNDYQGYQQVAKEYEGSEGTIPLYAGPLPPQDSDHREALTKIITQDQIAIITSADGGDFGPYDKAIRKMVDGPCAQIARAALTSGAPAPHERQSNGEPSRCKNTVAPGETMEPDTSTGDAPVVSGSALSQEENAPTKKLTDALAAMLDAFGGYSGVPACDQAIGVMDELGLDRWSMNAQMRAEDERAKR